LNFNLFVSRDLSLQLRDQKKYSNLKNEFFGMTTKFETFLLISGLMPESLVEHSLGPFYPFFVKFCIPQEVNVGFYVGMLQGATYFPAFVTNIFWGWISDRNGRKPVIIIGLIAVIISTLLFGLSTTFWLAFFCRVFAGIFGSNSTVIKCKLGECSDEVHRAWSYSMYGAAYGFTSLIGPALGGKLINPSVDQGSPLANDFFKKYPFLLVCFIVVGIFGSIILTLTILYLPENENMGFSNIIKNLSKGPYQSLEFVEMHEIEGENTIPKPSFNTWWPKNMSFSDMISFVTTHQAFRPIVLYCFIAFLQSMYMTAITLYLGASLELGGLGLSTKQVSFPFMFLSISKIFISFTPFYKLFQTYGANNIYGIALSLLGLVLFTMSYIHPETGTSLPYWFYFIFVLIGFAESAAYQAVIIMITSSVPANKLGITHGIACSCTSVMRSASPPISGSIWDAGVKLHFSKLILIISGCFAIFGVVASAGFSKTLKKHASDMSLNQEENVLNTDQ
jgi:MFS family permease